MPSCMEEGIKDVVLEAFAQGCRLDEGCRVGSPLQDQCAVRHGAAGAVF